MTNQEFEKARVLYNNLTNLINDCIKYRDIDLMIDVLHDVTRKFNIYIHLNPRDIVVVKTSTVGSGDIGRIQRIEILNRYGLEITIDLYPDMDNKYLTGMSVSYALVERLP